LPIINSKGRKPAEMGEMSTDQNAASCRTAADLLGQLIDLSGANGAENVVVSGQGQVELLVGLWRRGFARATCRAADRGPFAGEPPADLLFVPGFRSEAGLIAVLARLGREVRPGGTLVLQGECPTVRARRVRRLLGEHGFDTIEQRRDPEGDSFVLAARKRAAALQARAA
jgi:hypothetical protein